MMIKREHEVAIATAAALAVAAASLAHDPGYYVIDLGTLGGAESVAWDVNEDGVVVGAAQNAAGEWRAFRWSDGVMTDLGALGGGASSHARAVGPRGEVVGEAESSGENMRPFGWRAGGPMIDLGGLGGAAGAAYDLNARGVVVGAAENESGRLQAFRWVRLSIVGLATPDGFLAGGANAVNDSGRIVGWAADAEGVRVATVWDESAAPIAIGTLGGASSEAFAVGPAGQVVGVSDTTGPEPHAFIWRDGVMTDLGSFPIGGDSVAYDLNVIDEIVGRALLPSIGEYQAVFWKQGAIRNVNTLLPPGSGWETILSAHAINDSGMIAGVGRTDAGEIHAVLLDPKLGMANPLPGTAGAINLFDAAGATPFSTVHIAYGFTFGKTQVPICPDVTLEIEAPRLLASIQADQTGHALIELPVPEAARNRTILFQAIEQGSCERSVVMVWVFI